MANYFDRAKRQARRAERLAEVEKLSMPKIGNGSKITSQNAGLHAVALVSDMLSNYRLPHTPKLSYSGLKKAKTATSSSKIEDGVVTIHADFKTTSGVGVGIDIPVEIRHGELMEPSIIVHDGAPRVVAQSTFDDIVTRNSLMEELPVRDLFAAPMDPETAKKLYKDRIKLVRPQEHMFKLQSARDNLRAAMNGTLHVAESDTGYYDTAVTEHSEEMDEENHPKRHPEDRNQQDLDWRDPAERYEQHDIKPGDELTLKHPFTYKDRGGGKMDLPKGTKCKVLRDHAGDNKSFVVQFEGGAQSVIDRHFLKSAQMNSSFEAKINKELEQMAADGLSEIDAKLAIRSKFGQEIMEALFNKVGPDSE